MSDLIPEERLEILQAARDGKWGGRIELHLNDQGEIQNIVPSRVIRVKKKSPVGLACPNPGCGKQMESRDYGNLYVCTCGTKRTRSQLRVQGIAVPTTG